MHCIASRPFLLTKRYLSSSLKGFKIQTYAMVSEPLSSEGSLTYRTYYDIRFNGISKVQLFSIVQQLNCH